MRLPLPLRILRAMKPGRSLGLGELEGRAGMLAEGYQGVPREALEAAATAEALAPLTTPHSRRDFFKNALSLPHRGAQIDRVKAIMDDAWGEPPENAYAPTTQMAAKYGADEYLYNNPHSADRFIPPEIEKDTHKLLEFIAPHLPEGRVDEALEISRRQHRGLSPGEPKDLISALYADPSIKNPEAIEDGVEGRMQELLNELSLHPLPQPPPPPEPPNRVEALKKALGDRFGRRGR